MQPRGTGPFALQKLVIASLGVPEARSPKTRRVERAPAASPPDEWPAKTSHRSATNTRRPLSSEHRALGDLRLELLRPERETAATGSPSALFRAVMLALVPSALALGAVLAWAITARMVLQEINRYVDSEFRYAVSSDEAAVEAMVRDLRLQSEARRRFGGK